MNRLFLKKSWGGGSSLLLEVHRGAGAEQARPEEVVGDVESEIVEVLRMIKQCKKCISLIVGLRAGSTGRVHEITYGG
jgi:formylmethanofuran dehydrogenase subunit B